MIMRPSFLSSKSTSGDRERSASFLVRSGKGKSDQEMSEVANSLFSQVALEKAGAEGAIHFELRDCDSGCAVSSRVTTLEFLHEELREVPPSSSPSCDDRRGGGPVDVDDPSLRDDSGFCDLAVQSLAVARKVKRASGASGGKLIRMKSGGSARRSSVGASVNRKVDFRVNALDGDFV